MVTMTHLFTYKMTEGTKQIKNSRKLICIPNHNDEQILLAKELHQKSDWELLLYFYDTLTFVKFKISDNWFSNDKHSLVVIYIVITQ